MPRRRHRRPRPPSPISPSSAPSSFSSGCRANLPEGDLRSSSSPPPKRQRKDDVEQAPPTKRRKKSEPSSSTSKKRPSFLDKAIYLSASIVYKMRLRLSGGHFRMLNEKLYTSSGNQAFNLFQDEPDLFNVYHAGYQEQMSHWPEQPVNAIIKWLKKRSPSLTVADFGCGNAVLARSVKNKVFSIDLVSVDPSVISCDMSNTPLGSSSVDVAVFCLSLMGTNYASYLKEASRVLKPCGWLLIAEVRSRLDPNTNGADPDKFSEAVDQLGFSLVSKDFRNKMFVLFFFKKKERPSQAGSIDWPVLKPCIYKRR